MNSNVRRRHVFYIPGYDPFPARRYRELYRVEGEDQADISGYEISLKGKPGADPFGWQVKADINGQSVETDIDVLVWSDIVRGSMETGITRTYWEAIKTAWIYIRSGSLRRLMRLRKGPVVAALYPIGMLFLQALLAITVAWSVAVVASEYVYPGIGWVVALPAIILILRWFRKHDRKLFAYYLMHDYAFTAAFKGANPPELDARLQEFRKIIVAALASDVDEVLVVGHSSGAHLAVSVLAQLIREGRAQKNGPELGFLSLGQVIPMVSFLPKAFRLRTDLHELAQSDALTWVDVSAPGDGCSFALCDPVSVSGVSPENKRWPLVFSAAFSNSLSAERLKSLRHRYFRLHFQYLCAFDQPLDYDYFQITAGPLTLADRYRKRAPSKSRIDVSVSGYTSMLA